VPGSMHEVNAGCYRAATTHRVLVRTIRAGPVLSEPITFRGKLTATAGTRSQGSSLLGSQLSALLRVPPLPNAASKFCPAAPCVTVTPDVYRIFPGLHSIPVTICPVWRARRPLATPLAHRSGRHAHALVSRSLGGQKPGLQGVPRLVARQVTLSALALRAGLGGARLAARTGSQRPGGASWVTRRC
jgi:hypothetical protein